MVAQPTALRVEHATRPGTLWTARPRFSWVVLRATAQGTIIAVAHFLAAVLALVIEAVAV